MTSGLERSGPILNGKDNGEVNEIEKYNQKKKEASKKKQKEVSKVNKHTNNLRSAQIYNIF